MSIKTENGVKNSKLNIYKNESNELSGLYAIIIINNRWLRWFIREVYAICFI